MSKIKKSNVGSVGDADSHKGYNEKNPSQPQGAFEPDSMNNNDTPKKNLSKTITSKKLKKLNKK